MPWKTVDHLSQLLIIGMKDCWSCTINIDHCHESVLIMYHNCWSCIVFVITRFDQERKCADLEGKCADLEGYPAIGLVHRLDHKDFFFHLLVQGGITTCYHGGLHLHVITKSLQPVWWMVNYATENFHQIFFFNLWCKFSVA